MARIASQSQAGYYPTPPEEMEYVCQRLVVEKPGVFNLLDPCCGKGYALRQISEYLGFLGAKSKTYGCELEQSRAKEAKEVLDKAVTGGYEDLRATNKVFSFLWLNPPYDWREGIRTEQIFLNDITAPGRYLQTGGIMGFCIPLIALTHCAKLLAIRFENLRVYRFTDKNFPVFKQIVIFGARRAGRGENEEVKNAYNYLLSLANDPDFIPVIDEDDGWNITIPPSDGEVKLFRGYALNPEELARDIETSPVWEIVSNAYLTPEDSRVVASRPLTHLSPAHMATLMAAGAFNGRKGDHYSKGLTRRVTSEEVFDDGDVETRIETERHVSIIRVFTPEGVFDLE